MGWCGVCDGGERDGRWRGVGDGGVRVGDGGWRGVRMVMERRVG